MHSLKLAALALPILASASIMASMGSLRAQEPSASQPAKMDLGKVASGEYAADAAHSMVRFSVNHFGFNDYFGIFGDVSGTLSLDRADLGKSSVDVTIPVASVTVPSQGLKDHLLRPGADGGTPDFFGPQPQAARFVSTAVHPTGETSAHIMGNLTLNGVTRPVSIEAQLVGIGTNPMHKTETLGFHGTTSITRSEFGINYAVPAVSDEVKLEISIAFEK